MRRRKKFISLAVLVGVALGTWVVSAKGHKLERHAADRLAMVLEIGTDLDEAGAELAAPFYTRTIMLKKNSTVYVTFTGTGDTHNGARLLMRGEVDDEACTGGPGATPTLPGWTSLQKLPTSTGANNCGSGGGGTADCHDNNLIYTCCKNVKKKGPHTVSLRMASSTAGDFVFFEQAHVYVDSTKTGKGFCNGDDDDDDSSSSSDSDSDSDSSDDG